MEVSYQVDSLDLKILRALLKDGRKPLTEIASDLLVSTGTVHQRVEKMKASGVIEKFEAKLNPMLLGKPITALVGIHLNNAKDCPTVYDEMKKHGEVVELHFTTGTYALMGKVVCGSIPEFHLFLTEKLQSLKAIRSTETFFCLSTPIHRSVQP